MAEEVKEKLDTLFIKSEEGYNYFQEVIKEKFLKVTDIPETKLVKLILNTKIEKLIMSSSRWIGKSTLMAYYTLLNVMFNPDMNAVWCTSFQQQYKTRLRNPLEKALGTLLTKGVISKKQYNSWRINDKGFEYRGRQILFVDVNNLGNALGAQPTSGERHKGISPVYGIIFFEELIYDGQSITEEEKAVSGADSITSGLQNRSETVHPFIKLRSFYAFNPWSANSEFYHTNIEEPLKLGFEYVDKTRKEEAAANRSKLWADGEIYRTIELGTEEYMYTMAIWRGCYKLIPKHRFDKKNMTELKMLQQNPTIYNKRKYRILYLGIHSPQANEQYIYTHYMNESPAFEKLENITPEYILIGIDRGVVDRTAVIVCMPYIEPKTGKWKLFIYDCLSYYGKRNRSAKITIESIKQYLKDLIKAPELRNFVTILGVDIFMEPKATDFNSFFIEAINQDPILREVLSIKNGHTYKPHWKINTRIDFVGRLLRFDRITFRQNPAPLILWERLSVCMAKDNGEREEGRKNKLDEINALELAISSRRLRNNYYEEVGNEINYTTYNK